MKSNGCCSNNTLLPPGEGWGLEHQAAPDLRAPSSYEPSRTVNSVVQSSAGPAAYPQAGLKHKKLKGFCSALTLVSTLCRGPLLFLSHNPRKPGHPGGGRRALSRPIPTCRRRPAFAFWGAQIFSLYTSVFIENSSPNSDLIENGSQNSDFIENSSPILVNSKSLSLSLYYY
jgi:hypothetical protein